MAKRLLDVVSQRHTSRKSTRFSSREYGERRIGRIFDKDGDYAQRVPRHCFLCAFAVAWRAAALYRYARALRQLSRRLFHD